MSESEAIENTDPRLDFAAEYQEYTDLIKNAEQDSVSIICHDQPDPDCLSSAMAMKVIAEHFGKKADIYYGGEIGHTQNRIMVNVLDISASRFDSEDEEDTRQALADSIEKSFIVVVDTAHFGCENCRGISDFVDKDRRPDLVIDHHDLNPKVTSPYLRKPYGSCAAILSEMLESLEIPVGRILATALYLGINTDTHDLKGEGTSEGDHRAYEALKERIDLEKYLKVFNYPKPSALLDLRKRAYQTIQTSSTLAVASVGVITPQQRSLVAELCEEILEIESIETAVVMAVVDEGLKNKKALVASFRSGLLAINTKDFMTKIFGKKGVGGRKGAGGAHIPLDFIHCDTLDYIRSQHGDNGHLTEYTSHIFDSYAVKIKEEKENV
jgi:nanoRNase/pAp phosphatase (c-di-AMP/oligoRNAs hydrolase)